MRDGGLVMALDLATACGLAEGIPGSSPTASSESFAVTGGGHFAVGEKALAFFSDRLALARPAALFIERPGLHSIAAGKTGFDVIFRLLGLIFLAGVIARCRGVSDIRIVRVEDIRLHFLGAKNLKGADAKLFVQRRCTDLGWNFRTPDEADALAIWDYACETLKPGSGHPVAPGYWKTLAAEHALSSPRPSAKALALEEARDLFRPKARGHA